MLWKLNIQIAKSQLINLLLMLMLQLQEFLLVDVMPVSENKFNFLLTASFNIHNIFYFAHLCVTKRQLMNDLETWKEF